MRLKKLQENETDISESNERVTKKNLEKKREPYKLYKDTS